MYPIASAASQSTGLTRPSTNPATTIRPAPASAVGAILYEDEVQAFGALHSALGPMLDDLQDGSDADYMADPRWSEVVNAAAATLNIMRASG